MNPFENKSNRREPIEPLDSKTVGSLKAEKKLNEDKSYEQPERKGFIEKTLALIETKSPKLGELLRQTRIQALLLFLVLLIIYLNLIVWDFYFTSDTVEYGLMLKNHFEGGELSNQDLFRPAHPLTTPLAIVFTYPILPLIGSNYLLSFAALNAILGSITVALFYIFCWKIVGNRYYAFVCSLGLAFSFAFWENCEMAEDKILGFLIMVLYLPLLFAYVGEIKQIKWFTSLKPWQKSLITGLFMGLTIVAHFSFVLLFVASLIILWRYKSLKFFKSIEFSFYIFGAILISAIVFGAVAVALDVNNFSEFIGLFTKHHTGESEYFALSNPENFSILIQARDFMGGLFTTFIMFISDNPIYKVSIIGVGALIFLIMAFIMISARSNKIARSLYIIIIIWFSQYFFFGPGDRNAWVYLLIPVWLLVCIGLDKIDKEKIKLPFLKRNIPDNMKRYIFPMTVIIIVILLVNNGIVFFDAHVNHDPRIAFVHDTTENIEVDRSIMITDEPMMFFFSYFSDIEAINIIDVIRDPEISNYVNNSFENGASIYILEYWFRDSYIKVGTPRAAQTYDTRLQRHRGNTAAFNAMYIYQTVFNYEFSDIYQITELNQTR